MLWRKGKHGVGIANSNGHLLLSLEYGLLIINIISKLHNHHKTTYKHLRSNHYHLVGKSSMREDIQITRSFSVEEWWSNHRLTRLKGYVSIFNPICNNRTRRIWKVDVTNFWNNDILTSLQTSSDNKLTSILDNTDFESVSSAFINTAFETSYETLGSVRRNYQDWFDLKDPNIYNLLDNMHKCYCQWISNRNNATIYNEFPKARNTI